MALLNLQSQSHPRVLAFSRRVANLRARGATLGTQGVAALGSPGRHDRRQWVWLVTMITS
jgi:hypothetical protein